jgi:hypothetical protein
MARFLGQVLELIALKITGGAGAGKVLTSDADGYASWADAATTRTNLGLVIGTDVQAYDADLAAIAALTTTSYGRALLELANQAALQTAVGAPVGVSAFLASTQSTTSTTYATLTNHTFTIPPSKSLVLTGQVVFQSSVSTCGMGLYIPALQGASPNGGIVASGFISVAAAAGSAASALQGGGAINNPSGGGIGPVVGTAVLPTGTDHIAAYQATIKNNATNVSTTVNVQFAIETGSATVTAQVGTGCIGVIV